MFHFPTDNVFLVIDTTIAFGLLVVIFVSAFGFLKPFSCYKKLIKEFNVIGEETNINTNKFGIARMREIHAVANSSESKRLIEEAELLTSAYTKRFRIYLLTTLVTFLFVLYLFSKNYL